MGLTKMDIICVCVCVCVCVKERMSNKNVTILHLLYDILVCKMRHQLCVRVAFVSM